MHTVTQQDIDRSSTLEQTDLGRKFKVVNGTYQFMQDDEFSFSLDNPHSRCAELYKSIDTMKRSVARAARHNNLPTSKAVVMGKCIIREVSRKGQPRCFTVNRNGKYIAFIHQTSETTARIRLIDGECTLDELIKDTE